ncbi:MAG: HDIG domain-containing protein [candidate division WOR-3 bacterium]|nr:HDIG domain-containing protein [candidate division WOR-3 bacterium]MDH5684405.1 HDIG domain-containing protein [candidate division WOR-3 bacterium]
MDENEGLKLMESMVANKNLRKHMIATQACMRRLAKHFGEDEELWGFTGLIHDLDYDQTAQNPAQHGLIAADILKEKGIDESIIHAVKAHPGHVPVQSKLDKALYAVDPLTGLLVAAALMHPTKKLANLDTEFVLRRYNEKRFAAGANREQIATCTQLGLSLEEFIRLCLEAMQSVADQLSL